MLPPPVASTVPLEPAGRSRGVSVLPLTQGSWARAFTDLSPEPQSALCFQRLDSTMCAPPCDLTPRSNLLQQRVVHMYLPQTILTTQPDNPTYVQPPDVV